jgi:hypothetical protein
MSKNFPFGREWLTDISNVNLHFTRQEPRSEHNLAVGKHIYCHSIHCMARNTFDICINFYKNAQHQKLISIAMCSECELMTITHEAFQESPTLTKRISTINFVSVCPNLVAGSN